MAITEHGFDQNNNIYNLQEILDRIAALEAGTALKYDNIYPIGSIYITTENVNPANIFPGTKWEAFANGRTIIGVDSGDSDYNQSRKTGGSKTRSYTPQGNTDDCQLQESHLPSHRHNLGLHTHAFQYTGAKGSQTDSNIYTNYTGNGGAWAVNIWIPETSPSPTDIEDGTLDVRYVSNATQASNRLKVGTPEGETQTNATGGNLGHKHSFRAGTMNIDMRSPYITCYIWRRKA